MSNQKKQRAYHKAQLYRLLIRIVDNDNLSDSIFFKGGTCCAMLGYLDRFSVDLDFDLEKGADKKGLREEFHKIFADLGLEIKDESKKALQFFLKYDSPPGERNTIKLEVIDNPYESIEYEPQYLEDIDRTVVCQTLESMFANKLVALIDRYEKRETIAGRDVYDIHHFFSRGYDYKEGIIKERTGKDALSYLRKLKEFIGDKITQKIIDQDLNFLLPNEKFQTIRKSLKEETLMLIAEEIKRINETS
ncbi:MAG: nucleotidyl transferase AbiEii/AbiGii toxin family protein [Candidatus Paceibacterota bacterium]